MRGAALEVSSQHRYDLEDLECYLPVGWARVLGLYFRLMTLLRQNYKTHAYHEHTVPASQNTESVTRVFWGPSCSPVHPAIASQHCTVPPERSKRALKQESIRGEMQRASAQRKSGTLSQNGSVHTCKLRASARWLQVGQTQTECGHPAHVICALPRALQAHWLLKDSLCLASTVDNQFRRSGLLSERSLAGYCPTLPHSVQSWAGR